MSRTRGTSLPDASVAGSSTSPTSPAAERSGRPRWREPRLAAGLALVAFCAVLGARLVGGLDDTVGVWVASRALAEGQRVSVTDLSRHQVRFRDQADADRYLSADTDLPSEAALGRAVGAGELLPRGALRTAGPAALVEVPLSVAAESVPATVRVGSTVDVWVTGRRGGAAGAAPGGRVARSTLVLDDVAVVAAPVGASSLGPATTRSVVVGVPAAQRRVLPTSIAAVTGGDVLLTVQR